MTTAGASLESLDLIALLTATFLFIILVPASSPEPIRRLYRNAEPLEWPCSRQTREPFPPSA
jgi:hypothetical protein